VKQILFLISITMFFSSKSFAINCAQEVRDGVLSRYDLEQAGCGAAWVAFHGKIDRAFHRATLSARTGKSCSGVAEGAYKIENGVGQLCDCQQSGLWECRPEYQDWAGSTATARSSNQKNLPQCDSSNSYYYGLPWSPQPCTP
jgi:hypothetical protein